MSNEFPQGWTSTKLSNISIPRKGKKPAVLIDKPKEGFVPYLDICAIEKKNIRQYAEVKSSRLAEQSDLLVVWDGARSGWVGGHSTGAIGSTIMAITPQQIDSTYLRQFVASQFRILNTNTRGTGIPHVNPDVFWNLEVPVAPLAEQRRIVAKLEKVLEKVDTCQKRLEKIPILLKRFRQSVLAAACSGRLTADWREKNSDVSVDKSIRDKATDDPTEMGYPTNWALCRVQNLFKSFGGGTPNKGTKAFWGGNIPWLSSGDIKEERIKTASEFITKPGLESSSANKCKKGAVIVVVRSGILKHTLPVAILDCDAAINQDIKCFDSGSVELNEWLSFALRASALSILARNREGTTVQSVKYDTLKNFLLPVPPLEEQKEISRQVSKLMSLAGQLESRFNKAKAHTEKLTQSILAKAFRGELVPQDPNDEPASALLERIRTESDQNMKKENGNGRRPRKKRSRV